MKLDMVRTGALNWHCMSGAESSSGEQILSQVSCHPEVSSGLRWLLQVDHIYVWSLGIADIWAFILGGEHIARTISDNAKPNVLAWIFEN